ncbi:hypothetical protein [Actinoplanes sp. NBRC 101535]|uniref:hypothetical protein n=1 Tax=Actinoplanes sp. NBRC 101535 TaxID=3032196 RepID=UPI0024A3B1A1|nr:hypothetical protein [Actinoplanes sp. NBRC 101535]GLY08301.1 hypothetical protein Acsp01_86800 [Actinoplanes sp. NBRC 101535]
MTTSYEVPDGPKMLRETLSVAQACIGGSDLGQQHKEIHIARLGRLIDECDRHRPLGPDGKHRDLHTGTCGCQDVPASENHLATSEEVTLIAAAVAWAEADGAGDRGSRVAAENRLHFAVDALTRKA